MSEDDQKEAESQNETPPNKNKDKKKKTKVAVEDTKTYKKLEGQFEEKRKAVTAANKIIKTLNVKIEEYKEVVDKHIEHNTGYVNDIRLAYKDNNLLKQELSLFKRIVDTLVTKPGPSPSSMSVSVTPNK